MNNLNSLSHSKWECKYHVVWIPKCRRKVLFGQLRKHLGELFHDLARQKNSKILEGHLQQDHVHVLMSIPPKYSVAQVVGYIKRQKCNSYSSHLPWAKEELWWDEFLGTRLFRLNCRYR
jgi:putative transposase